MRVSIIVALVLAASAGGANGQAIPEGVYSPGEGPSELCGVHGENVAELARKVRASPEFAARDIGSDRFELFETTPLRRQFVFTREGEAAHPTTTCREMVQRDGAVGMQRSIRCEADRAACDALYLEFRSLDERTAAHAAALERQAQGAR